MVILLLRSHKVLLVFIFEALSWNGESLRPPGSWAPGCQTPWALPALSTETPGPKAIVSAPSHLSVGFLVIPA